MDSDSSTKFIASLTKFLQSLCNGYVEFQNGVELAGHIYLSIDTGEKVDYILHEKVCKNDENSVTFISNSFHALPADKRKDGKQPEQSKDAQSKTSAKSDARSKDDDDVVILDHDSSSSGTSSRGMKRSASPGLDQRHRTSGQRNASGSLQGSGTRQGSRGIRQQPSATVTSQDEQRGENFDAGDVKLEQMTTDELLSLASQVSDTPGGPPQRTSAASHRRTTPPRPRNSREAPQEMWIKQEVTDDADVLGGSDSGQSWPHGRDDSNSGPGGGLYPVMLHQNTAAFSPTGFPVFPTTSQHHGLGQPLPSTSSASHPYANPIPGTSQGAGAVDPAVGLAFWSPSARSAFSKASVSSPPEKPTRAEVMRQYRQRIKQNPERYAEQKRRDALRRQKPRRISGAEAMRRFRERLKQDPEKYEAYRLKDTMRRKLKKLEKEGKL